MSDIYRNAEEVIVWLGAKHEHMDKAIDQILELGPASYLSSMPKYRMCEHNRYRNQGYVEEAFDSLHKFIDSAWFQRLWVIQEITLLVGLIYNVATVVFLRKTSRVLLPGFSVTRIAAQLSFRHQMHSR